MDLLKRALDPFLSRSAENAVNSLTSDNTRGVLDSDCQEILQALLGGNKMKTPIETVDLLASRWQANWNWRVLLKALFFLQYVMDSNSTTISWLQHFFADLAILTRCAEFGNADTPQDASHSHILRAYAQFLKLYYSSITDPDSPHGKVRRLQDLPEQLGFEKKETLISMAETSLGVLQRGTSVFVASSVFHIPHGFNQLTACVAARLLRPCLRIYSVVSLLVVALLDRIEILNIGDVKRFASACELFLALSADMLVFCDAVKAFPGPQLSIPELTIPDKTTLLVIKERLKDLEIAECCTEQTSRIEEQTRRSVSGEKARVFSLPEGHQLYWKDDKMPSSLQTSVVRQSAFSEVASDTRGVRCDSLPDFSVCSDPATGENGGGEAQMDFLLVSEPQRGGQNSPLAQSGIGMRCSEPTRDESANTGRLPAPFKEADQRSQPPNTEDERNVLERQRFDTPSSRNSQPVSSREGHQTESLPDFTARTSQSSRVRVVHVVEPLDSSPFKDSDKMFRQASLLGHKLPFFPSDQGRVEQ